jgi:hypothetical protein
VLWWLVFLIFTSKTEEPKIIKVFILAGLLEGNSFISGPPKTLLFLTAFLILCALIHLTYPSKTCKWAQTWLGFIVGKEDNSTKFKRIVIYYYSTILVSAIISLVICQVVIKTAGWKNVHWKGHPVHRSWYLEKHQGQTIPCEEAARRLHRSNAGEVCQISVMLEKELMLSQRLIIGI